MYFPYFRGRQYELLALKELALGKLIRLSKKSAEGQTFSYI